LSKIENGLAALGADALQLNIKVTSEKSILF